MKVKGLKKIAGDSKFLNGPYGAEYIQVVYDKDEHKAWGNWFCDLGHSWRTVYQDESIIDCGIITTKRTMQDIKEMIERAIERSK